MNKPIYAVLLAGSLALGACSTYGNNDETLESAGTGAAVGAVAGAGLGAVVGGLSPIEGAAIGAAVGGLAGAIWADNDNDGYADGYVREGQYYQGRPTQEMYPEPAPGYQAPAPTYQSPPPVRRRSGERG
jgi:phage tail tape-measure protein